MKKPVYAVIFTSKRSQEDPEGYEKMAHAMVQLASQQPGFVGMESTRDASGFGITVSYWESLEAIHSWKNHLAHREAQEAGRSRWYESFKLRICRIESEKEYSG